MKKLLIMMCLMGAIDALAQEQTQQQQGQRPRQRRQSWSEAPNLSLDSTTRNGYTLIFVNNDTTFQAEGADIKKRMIETFYKVYPAQAKDFNPNTAKRVVFWIDRNYTGVAATGGTVVRYKPSWMLKKPTDIDVVTHEVMHIVQSYQGGAQGVGWLTEGIADYVRAVYGVDNEGAKWALPKGTGIRPDPNKPGEDPNAQGYTKSYRITAKFLLWIEKNVKKGVVATMDSKLRSHTYTADAWKEYTGKTLDELWTDYVAVATKES
ncbi:basic secretory protein-like protein [Mucilaginibacter antarcticus]|uniref:Basic secretory protein-like protein n=1 Tax=Mucilaginibacter antarcticus TaxID=1855725 RepID=A0ABW5XM27_9SPHI